MNVGRHVPEPPAGRCNIGTPPDAEPCPGPVAGRGLEQRSRKRGVEPLGQLRLGRQGAAAVVDDGHDAVAHELVEGGLVEMDRVAIEHLAGLPALDGSPRPRVRAARGAASDACCLNRSDR